MRAVLHCSITTALVSAPAAYAQSNTQYQGGDATAVTDVEAGWAHDAGATAIAGGNAVATTQEDNDTAPHQQSAHGRRHHRRRQRDRLDREGNVAITSAAVGNGGTAVISERLEHHRRRTARPWRRKRHDDAAQRLFLQRGDLGLRQQQHRCRLG
jgi:hypothetical protein